MKLPALTQAEFCSTLVDEWVRSGVRAAVTSPGSRSAPLALALVADGRLDVRVQLDERSASYMALGIGLASQMPAVVLTTSGTAAAELHPAVVEADLARVPLIVCTADRPPELKDVGAPQTIEQRRLFGTSVRWFLEAGVADEAGRHTWRSLGSRLVAEALAGPTGPGPVHLNLAFREPLLAPAGSLLDLPPGRAAGRPWHGVARARRLPARSHLEVLGPLLVPGRRGVIVAGAGSGEPAAVLALSGRLGWPVLADPRSGCRLTTPGATVVAAADALLRDDGFRAAHQPDVVLRLGQPWASKVMAGWLAETAAAGAVHIVTDPDWAWRDPGREAALHIGCDPGELLAAVLTGGDVAGEDARNEGGVGDADPGPAANRWQQAWASAEEGAQRAIDDVLSKCGDLTEPFVARHLYASAGVGTIVAASSMPVRDLEWFARPADRTPRVLSNRGANGIDGVSSTVLGVAAAATGPPPSTAGSGESGAACPDASGPDTGGSSGPATAGVTVGLLGDLAFLHDLTAFVRPDGERRARCVFVVVDNHGGGIFSFLPQAAELDEAHFERLFGTPQRPDAAGIARGFGLEVMEAGTRSGYVEVLARAVERALDAEQQQDPLVVVAKTERQRNVEVHAELNAAVSSALAGLTD